jgi:large subunit ribosomal protein L4
LNKKIKVLARKSVLSARVAENNLIIVEDFNIDSPKTKAYIQFLNALSLSGKKTLFVVNGGENNLYLSARNIPKTKVVDKDSVNTYDLINTEIILLAESTVSHLESILKD